MPRDCYEYYQNFCVSIRKCLYRCFRVREYVTRFPVVLLIVLSETEVVAYLGHSSLNSELSQFIVPKLIWPSSGTFQHHHQLSTSQDTASWLLGRLDTHQRTSLCGQLEFVSRTSLIAISGSTVL